MDTAIASHSYSYFARFNETDMRVRTCQSSSQCQSMYIKALRPLQPSEQEILQPFLDRIDTICRTAGYKRLLHIPWTFRIIPDTIENGFPHTHGDTIMLPESVLKNPTMETLLHEKLHVYQRLYPIETHRLIVDQWRFEPIGVEGTGTGTGTEKIRQNPDTNEIRYAYRGMPLQATYHSHAQSLGDVRYPHSHTDIPSLQRDHPFEVMACMLSTLILTDPSHNTDTHRDTHILKAWYQPAYTWMRTYL